MEQQLPMMVGIQYNHHDFHYELSYSCNKTSFLGSELLPSGLELCYEVQSTWLGPHSHQGLFPRRSAWNQETATHFTRSITKVRSYSRDAPSSWQDSLFLANGIVTVCLSPLYLLWSNITAVADKQWNFISHSSRSWKPEIRMPVGSVGDVFWVSDFLLCLQKAKGPKGLSGASFIKALITYQRPHSTS